MHYLGEQYPNVYYTRRELECLHYLMKGYTITKTADHLQLSHRTVEFYLKNMRMKVGAQSKEDLLNKMRCLPLPRPEQIS